MRILLAGALVADFAIDAPVLHVNRAHFEKERADQVDVRERGRQDALRARYPLEINELRGRDGALTYFARHRAHERRPVKSVDDFRQVPQGLKEGDVVTLRVERQGARARRGTSQ